MLSPDFSLLPEAQKKIWSQLGGSKDCGFTLYGGTALSLRFGHRQSVDFDFFSDESINDSKLYTSIPLLSDSMLLQEEKDTYIFLTNNNVKLSFFGDISFGCVQPPDLTEDNVLYVASTLDIFGTKLKTILQRISEKDYIDIAEIISRGTSLELGVSAAISLFKNRFPEYDAVRALTYFDVKELKKFSDKYKNILIDAARHINYNKICKMPIISQKLNCYPLFTDQSKYIQKCSENPLFLKEIPCEEQTEAIIQAALDGCRNCSGVNPSDLLEYADNRFTNTITNFSGQWMPTPPNNDLVWSE